MQIPIIPFRGQKKPWGSIPRINWQHPLASGLKVYLYDAGGVVLGLARGGIGTKFVSTNDISIKTSTYGSGVKYAGTTTATNIVFPLRASPSGITATAPFSFAMGAMNTAAPVASATIAGDADTATNNNFAIGAGATTTTFLVFFNNGTTNLTTAANTNSLNVFHTVVATVPTSTTANIYCDGKFDQISTVGTKTINLANTQFVINSGALNGTSFGGGSNGFVYYFAGWKRTLSAAEARLLHDDPYCFLIYPEDEMMASLVGVTAGPTTSEDQWHQGWSNVGRRYAIIGTG